MRKSISNETAEIIARFEQQEKEMGEEPQNFLLCGVCDTEIYEGNQVGTLFPHSIPTTVCIECYKAHNKRIGHVLDELRKTMNRSYNPF